MTGDRTCILGMGPDRSQTRDPLVCGTMLQPEPHAQGDKVYSCNIIYCITSHRNKTANTFAHPCIVVAIHLVR